MLPAVAVWQSKRPETPLYLIYFGRVPPEVYDIKYAPDLLHPCMLGVSTTTLQGIYLEPGKKQTFRPLWNVAARGVGWDDLPVSIPGGYALAGGGGGYSEVDWRERGDAIKAADR